MRRRGQGDKDEGDGISTLQNRLWWKFSKFHQTLTPDGLLSTDKEGAQLFTLIVSGF